MMCLNTLGGLSSGKPSSPAIRHSAALFSFPQIVLSVFVLCRLASRKVISLVIVNVTDDVILATMGVFLR